MHIIRRHNTQVAQRQGFGEWSGGPHDTLQFDMDLYALLPIGYDGWVVAFYICLSDFR